MCSRKQSIVPSCNKSFSPVGGSAQLFSCLIDGSPSISGAGELQLGLQGVWLQTSSGRQDRGHLHHTGKGRPLCWTVCIHSDLLATTVQFNSKASSSTAVLKGMTLASFLSDSVEGPPRCASSHYTTSQTKTTSLALAS